MASFQKVYLLTLAGVISGNTITGNITGTIVCNGATFNLSGNFSVTKVSDATLASDSADSAVDRIRGYVNRMGK